MDLVLWDVPQITNLTCKKYYYDLSISIPLTCFFINIQSVGLSGATLQLEAVINTLSCLTTLHVVSCKGIGHQIILRFTKNTPLLEDLGFTCRVS